MENKSWAYKFGYICGAIVIGIIVVALSSLIIAGTFYLIRTMF